MKVDDLIEILSALQIKTVVGVPDSVLNKFCDRLINNDLDFEHYIVPNEGSAIGMATGIYLGSGKPACVYMQNSGIGNIVNPYTSLVHREIYQIPMVFVIGWRGKPGEKDEPQHQFMGRITCEILDVLEIPYVIIDQQTSKQKVEQIIQSAKKEIDNKSTFAIIVSRGTFEEECTLKYKNDYLLQREEAIRKIISQVEEDDMIISTTGKISREVYEQSDLVLKQHRQTFLTVGGMGHASSIACALAKTKKEKRVICIDGDGAILMHMGILAFIGEQQPENFIHICLNNCAHESVGGMPTGSIHCQYDQVAKVAGYREAICVNTAQELEIVLNNIKDKLGPIFIQVNVMISSRTDLGRPKESAITNKVNFMEYHGVSAKNKLSMRRKKG